MKSYCKGLVMDRDHIAKAYEIWSKAESGRKNAWRVPKEHGSVDALIDELAEEIEGRCLRLRPIRHHLHIEPTNGKERDLGIESVKQQVLEYSVLLALWPMFDAKRGYWQVAGVKGKGQKACKRGLRRWVNETRYHNKSDVYHCYYEVSHKAINALIEKYVRSTDVLYCHSVIMRSFDPEGTGKGILIGSRYSLELMNFVLSFGYHYVESLHKVRRGKRIPLVKHQIWHMDDVLLLGNDKRDLKRAMRLLDTYLQENFGLRLKAWKVSRTGDIEPLDMGGFVVRRERCTLRAHLFNSAKRAFARIRKRRTLRLAQRACSYWGWLRNADCDGFISDNKINLLFRIARKLVSRAGKARHQCIETKALPS